MNYVHIYISSQPSACPLFSNYDAQVSVVDASRSGEKPFMVPVDIEPTIVALGPLHVAVAMNDRVIFYRASENDKSQVYVQHALLVVMHWYFVDRQTGMACECSGTITQKPHSTFDKRRRDISVCAWVCVRERYS